MELLINKLYKSIKNIPKNKIIKSINKIPIYNNIRKFNITNSIRLLSTQNENNKNQMKINLFNDIEGTKHYKDALIILFTCKVCKTRSARKISKEAYNKGVVIIRCPTCNNLHLIADNMEYFSDKPLNIEMISKEAGKKVQRIDDSHVYELTEEDLKLLKLNKK